MLRPGSEGFKPAALLALCSAFTYSCSQILARRLGAKDSASMMAFYAMALYAYAGGAIALVIHLAGPFESNDPTLSFLTRPWSMPGGMEFAMLATTGVISAMGFYLLSQAYRIGKANVVAPFEYSSLVWAVGLTFLVYGTSPDAYTFLGAAIILAAGIYVLRREKLRGEKPLAAKGPYRSR
jgi:drug/metabolite transporter (DMT)-like permease